MPLLTLSVSRGIAVGGFDDGSYAYAVAEKPVRKDGELITPEPLVDESRGGEMSFDIPANSEIDDSEEFKYMVAAFDKYGVEIFKLAIIMPSLDASIWDLYPEPINLDRNDVSEAPLGVGNIVTAEQALNTLQGRQLAAHIAAPIDQVQPLAQFVTNARGYTLYTFKMVIGGTAYDVGISPSTIDWDTVNSWEDVLLWIQENTPSQIADGPVKFLFSGVRFSAISEDGDVDSIQFVDHGTSNGGYMRLDNELGFTTGPFGQKAVNSIFISGAASSEPIITGGLLSEPTAPVRPFVEDFSYYVSGNAQQVNGLIIDQNMEGRPLAIMLQNAIPNSEFWYDGERLRMRIADLTGVAPTGLGALLNLDFLSGAKISFPVGSALTPTLS